MIRSFKIRYWIILCLLTFISSGVFAQSSIVYGYDENGNRTSRVLIVEELGSKGSNIPVEELKNLPVEKLKDILVEDPKEELKETEGELKILVYPNPNKGLIKIDISYMPMNSKTEARLYNLSGTELMVKRNFESSSEMDINRFKDGIYILRIIINNTVTSWKIIKYTN